MLAALSLAGSVVAMSFAAAITPLITHSIKRAAEGPLLVKLYLLAASMALAA